MEASFTELQEAREQILELFGQISRLDAGLKKPLTALSTLADSDTPDIDQSIIKATGSNLNELLRLSMRVGMQILYGLTPTAEEIIEMVPSGSFGDELIRFFSKYHPAQSNPEVLISQGLLMELQPLGRHWIIDRIATHLHESNFDDELTELCWKVVAHDNHGAALTASWDYDTEPLITDWLDGCGMACDGLRFYSKRSEETGKWLVFREFIDDRDAGGESPVSEWNA